MNEASEVKIGIESLTSLVNKAKNDPKTLKRIIDDPLKELESIGMSIEEQFRDAVASDLTNFARIQKMEAEMEEGVLTPSSAPMEAEMEEGEFTPFPEHLELQKEEGVLTKLSAPADPIVKTILQPWGITVRYNPEGVRQMKAGGNILAGIMGGISVGAALSPDPTVSKGVAALAGFMAAYLACHVGVIDLVDKGKGVYVTLTWLHYLLTPLGAQAFPIITPIT